MSLSDNDEAPVKPSRTTVDLTLRTKQVQYLEYIAERDDIPLSHALGQILASAIETEAPATERKTIKIRKHFSLTIQHVQFLDKLSTRYGLWRSDIARRLIDDALSKDRTI